MVGRLFVAAIVASAFAAPRSRTRLRARAAAGRSRARRAPPRRSRHVSASSAPRTSTRARASAPRPRHPVVVRRHELRAWRSAATCSCSTRGSRAGVLRLRADVADRAGQARAGGDRPRPRALRPRRRRRPDRRGVRRDDRRHRRALRGDARACAGRAAALRRGGPRGRASGTQPSVDLLRGVEIAAVKHVHSAGKQPDGDDGYHVPVPPTPTTTVAEHPPTSEDLVHLLGHLPDEEGGSVLYRFRVGDLSLVWHDTSGPLADDAPPRSTCCARCGRSTSSSARSRASTRSPTACATAPVHRGDPARAVRPRPSRRLGAGDTTSARGLRGAVRRRARADPGRAPPGGALHPRPADYVRPEALTFPVLLDEPRLVRRCTGRGRLRVELRGDVADVRGAVLQVGRRATKGWRAVPCDVLTRVGARRARRPSAGHAHAGRRQPADAPAPRAVLRALGGRAPAPGAGSTPPRGSRPRHAAEHHAADLDIRR